MLKFKKLETYYPDKKIINLLEQTTNDKVNTTNGIARAKRSEEENETAIS